MDLCGQKKASQALQDGLTEIEAGYRGTLMWKEAIEEFRARSKIYTPVGGRVEPLYWEGNVLFRWKKYADSLHLSVGRVLRDLRVA